MSIIKKLSQNTIDKIAAGEVVERPASAIKELIENAIDANADKIIVTIKNGGLDLIQVEDNGIGMIENDAIKSLDQHSTSKISEAEDLFSIYTLGFRGEALASISAISNKTEITTKHGSETHGTTVTKLANSITSEPNNKTINGTQISIHGLFEQVPARKKFIKSSTTELKHIISSFTSIALPHLNIHFELYNDNNRILQLTKTQDLRTRLFEAFKKDFNNHSILNEIDINGIKISGLIGTSELGQKTNKYQYLYINKRFFTSFLINRAIQQAFQGFIHKDLKPAYFLQIEVNPVNIDINVHPRKLEIKFDNEQEIFSYIYKFVKSSLENHNKEQFNLSKIENNDTSNNFLSEISKPTQNTFSSKSNYIKPFSKSDNNKAPIKRQLINDTLKFTEQLYSVEDTNNSEYTASNSINSSIKYEPTQIFNTYIMYEKEGKLILVDQHAAAEKILFDKLIATHTDLKTKSLLVPEILDLNNKAEKEILINSTDDLKRLGIEIEDFGDNSVAITSIPEISTINSVISSLEVFINNDTDDIEFSEDFASKYNISKHDYIKIATIACHSSIRAGQVLSKEEMINILKDIEQLEPPYHCPHGRPIFIQINKTEIENKFNRDI